ncbi:Bacteriophage protein [Mycobacteroides abscessus subsp. massiliense]|uniref:phage portal protein n=1 Tax=Mycobacteroides abscessus TaxID=36809 RepID=UPI0009A5ABC6|nr:phage portal protein [Mycobacteroides abscessus]SKS09586.1 Bacteriophage protein [Mycobacteroides abscessus subsp. massiliense]
MAVLSPSEWFDRLQARFTAPTTQRWQDKADRPLCPRPRNQHLDLLWSHYVGDPPLPQIADEFQDIFRDLMRKSRSNYAEMCVTAVVNRMDLLAVSTGADDTANGDDRATEIMEDSGFAAQFKDLLAYFCAMGESYAMVVPTPTGPTIHAIDPRRCVAIEDPYNPVRLRAVLVKSYDVESEEEIAHLFLPGEKWTLQRDGTEWKRLSETPEAVTGLDDLGGIPVVRLKNKLGMGEYEAHVDVLDRIIDTTLSRMVLTKYQSFKQRGVSGDEDIDEDEDDYDAGDVAGKPKQVTNWGEVFKAGPGAVWKVPAGWQFWESGATDLGPMLQAKRDDVKEFAAVTHTPLYLITPDDANGSAQGAGLLREALTSKVRDRRARVVPQLKLLWRIVFAMDGDPSRGKTIKLHWGPIEFNSLAEKGSATAQAKDVLSRRRILSEIWEMSPQDIEDNEIELSAERLLIPAAPVATTTPRNAPVVTNAG